MPAGTAMPAQRAALRKKAREYAVMRVQPRKAYAENVGSNAEVWRRNRQLRPRC